VSNSSRNVDGKHEFWKSSDGVSPSFLSLRRSVVVLLFCCSVVSFFFVFVEIARAARQTLVFRYDVAATGWSNALKTWSLDGETHW